jgi:hypothetical protein
VPACTVWAATAGLGVAATTTGLLRPCGGEVGVLTVTSTGGAVPGVPLTVVGPPVDGVAEAPIGAWPPVVTGGAAGCEGAVVVGDAATTTGLLRPCGGAAGMLIAMFAGRTPPGAAVAAAGPLVDASGVVVGWLTTGLVPNAAELGAGAFAGATVAGATAAGAVVPPGAGVVLTLPGRTT